MKEWWLRTCADTYLTSRSDPQSFMVDGAIIGIFGIFGLALVEEPSLAMMLTPAAGIIAYAVLNIIASHIGHREILRRITADPAKSQAWNELSDAVNRCATAGMALDRDTLTAEQREQVVEWLAQAARLTVNLEHKLGADETTNPYTFPEAQRAVIQINDLTGKIEALRVKETA